MINIAIVEDEELYAKQLQEFLHQYEKENDYVFSGTESYDVCCKLLKTSIFKAQRLVSEYNKFRKSTEKTEDI